MFEIKAGTVIQLNRNPSDAHHFTTMWFPYTTKEDKIYEKEEVYDFIRVNNDSVPFWIHNCVMEHGKVVIARAGKFALVNPADIEYLD